MKNENEPKRKNVSFSFALVEDRKKKTNQVVNFSYSSLAFSPSLPMSLLTLKKTVFSLNFSSYLYFICWYFTLHLFHPPSRISHVFSFLFFFVFEQKENDISLIKLVLLQKWKVSSAILSVITFLYFFISIAVDKCSIIYIFC